MESPLRVTSRLAPSIKFTYEDFVRFPDDGKRHELIDGDHYVTPSPSLGHQTVSGRLFLAIASYLDAHSIGRVWAAPLDVVLSHVDVVEPDLLYVSNDRASILTAANVQGPPDLTIEILSPGTRRVDEGVKRRAYERHGVGEYWIIDPPAKAVTIYRLHDGRLECAVELFESRRDTLTSPLFPDLAIKLADLFRA